MRGNRIVMLALGAALSLVAAEAIGAPVVDATRAGHEDVLKPPATLKDDVPAIRQVLPQAAPMMRQLFERPAMVPQARVSKLGVKGERRPAWMSFASPPLVPRPG